MAASRKTLLKHFNARAAEYRAEMSGDEAISDSGLDQSGNPVCLFVVFLLSFRFRLSPVRLTL